jgi:hypothetical protein
MGGERMDNLVHPGKIQGKRDRGRQREKILDGVCRYQCVKDNKDIFKNVQDRTRWRNMFAKVFRMARDDDE